MPKDDELRVSVILLTWNARGLAADAVASCLAQTRAPDEVLVVDNASEDDTLDVVARRFPGQVRILLNERNLGYAGGHNRGLAIASGDVVLLLNPDVRLAPAFLEHALPAFDDERVGLVAGRLVRGDEATLDSTGLFLGRSRRALDRGFGKPVESARAGAGPILGPCGAAALYRRAMIDDVADDGRFFDEDYFAYNEDLEVAWRAWRAGWRARHVPEAEAIHLRGGGAAAGRFGRTFDKEPELVAHIVKNRYLAMLRHDAPLALLADLPFVALRDMGLWGAMLLRRRGALAALWRQRGCFARALAKRRGDRGRAGSWGRWSRRVPPRGVWRDGSGIRA